MVGEMLHRHRHRAGLTQTTLARRAGISVRALRDIEQDRVRHPHPHSLRALADALGLCDADRDRLLGAAGADPTRRGERRSWIGVLGPLVAQHGDTLVEVGPGKQRSLLALLALRPSQVVAREEIVDVLWGDRPPRTCAGLVNTYVARLRAVIEPGRGRRPPGRLLLAGRGYLLQLDSDQSDLLLFREQEARGAAARVAGHAATAQDCYARALECWRGPVLADLDFRVRQHPAAVAVGERRVAAALALADIAFGRRCAEQAVPHLRALVTDEPLHEGLHARLMLALAFSGRQAAALAIFADLRTRLLDELGVEPGAEMQSAHARVLRRQPPGPTAPVTAPAALAAGRIRPAQLPADVAAFTGRAEQLRRLDSLLPAEDSRRPAAVVISAIAGTAGVGKTALALHWAHRVRDRFPDGSLFANLRGFDPRSAPVPADEVLDGFLRALGVRPEAIPPTVDERSALFRTLLDGRRMLLVLDNAARSEQVRHLVPGAPGCMVVATSRSRLTGLVAGSGAHRITVDLLPPPEAVALLRAVLGAERTDAEPQATAELAGLCAYLPLALRLVAERATTRPHLSLTGLVREVAASDDDRLDLLSADDDETTAVRAAFSWSYRALAPDAARMFRLLGLHPGPDISLAAAAALAGVDRDRARRLLGTLTGMHLLEETGRDRYRFHDLLAAYARGCAHADEPERARSHSERQVLDWYLRTADAADRMLIPGRRHIPLDPLPPATGPPELAGAAAALEWCEAERVNLVAATRRAAEIGDHATAWRLPLALWSYFAIRKRWADWISTHRVALTAARHGGDSYGEALACTSLAHAYRDLRRFDEAIDHFRQALGICRQIGEQWVEAAALSLLGIADRDLGRFDEAIDCSRRALGIFEATGDLWGRGWTLYSLGEIYKDQRRFGAAIHCSQQALATFTEIDDRWGRSSTLSVLGQACRNLGRLDEAIDYSRQALAAAREIGNQQGEGLALYTLGKALRDTGETRAARQAWQRALATFENLGAPQVDRVRERLRDLDASH